jgi:hypothetical protein
VGGTKGAIRSINEEGVRANRSLPSLEQLFLWDKFLILEQLFFRDGRSISRRTYELLTSLLACIKRINVEVSIEASYNIIRCSRGELSGLLHNSINPEHLESKTPLYKETLLQM